MNMHFTHTKVRVSPNALIQELNGEAVLLDLDSEVYFGLDEVGTEMWSALNSTPTVDQAWQSLCFRFDTTPETLMADLDSFVVELVKLGLLQDDAA